MGFWDNKKVLVTGGAGFIGSHLVEELLRRGKGVRVTVADNFSHGREANLEAVRSDISLLRADFRSPEDCRKACQGAEVVLNLAARVAGVAYNAEHPATMFRENMLMACHMMEAARLAGVERFLAVSSACVYPREAMIPTPEGEGFKGSPEITNEGYGWAKRMAEYLGRAYHQEHGMTVAIARPYNAYGPRDHFGSQDCHVIAALIGRILGGEDPVLVWGDGSQSRAFLYVEDLARGLLDSAERCAECDPVNIGTDEEIKIRDLAELILKVSGSRAKLIFDAAKPSGQPRRNCDTSKARQKMGFLAQVGLEEGLARTIAWCRENQEVLGLAR
ncbi:MAG: NAD-dependent epimerase/dehydratase family protein [Elusimicrobia bacterium]|nr:NAD-dependent epimerase/dehydratase family protein [Elusimicrobiota bacterium]